MDQVQRAYESQLRREDCKRKQLQNSVRAHIDAMDYSHAYSRHAAWKVYTP
jgi:hypothetical protein